MVGNEATRTVFRPQGFRASTGHKGRAGEWLAVLIGIMERRLAYASLGHEIHSRHRLLWRYRFQLHSVKNRPSEMDGLLWSDVTARYAKRELPGIGAVLVKEATGGAIVCLLREADDGDCALFDGLGAGVVVEVSCGEAGAN
jgi:hypothetical protein